MPIWDKAVLFHDIEGFIEHLQRLDAQGCRWLVVPLTADELSGSLKCSKCNSDTDLAALYSIATHVAFEKEVLRAIEASHSQAEYDDQVSRIIEEEGTPMVCTACCPSGRPHRHDYPFASPLGASGRVRLQEDEGGRKRVRLMKRSCGWPSIRSAAIAS